MNHGIHDKLNQYLQKIHRLDFLRMSNKLNHLFIPHLFSVKIA